MMKKEIESFGNVILTPNSYGNTCILTSDQVMDLKQFCVLLGFSADTARLRHKLLENSLKVSQKLLVFCPIFLSVGTGAD